MVGSDPHEFELTPGFEVCQMKGTHIVVSELTLFKSYEIGLLRIRPLYSTVVPQKMDFKLIEICYSPS